MRDDRVLIVGIVADHAWLDERAFQYGDGLFETIAIVDGGPCLWDAHMARLAEGCRRLRLPQPDLTLLYDECRELSSGIARATLKIYWTAGDSQRGYRRPQPVVPRRILRLVDSPIPQRRDGWQVRQCAHRLSANPTLAGIKHLNRLDQVVARSEWDDTSIDEGIMLGQNGDPVCGTMSNLFIQRGRNLSTPPIVSAGIAGVIRQTVLNLAKDDAAAVFENPVSLAELHAADAMFLTNSLIGVARVARFESTAFDTSVTEHPAIVEARARCHQPDNPQ